MIEILVFVGGGAAIAAVLFARARARSARRLLEARIHDVDRTYRGFAIDVDCHDLPEQPPERARAWATVRGMLPHDPVAPARREAELFLRALRATRAQLVPAGWSATMDGDDLLLRTGWRPVADGLCPQLDDDVRRVASLARAFVDAFVGATRAEICTKIIDTAFDHDEPDAIDFVLERFSAEIDRDAIMARCLENGGPQLRVYAATMAGADGVPVLVAIAQSGFRPLRVRRFAVRELAAIDCEAELVLVALAEPSGVELELVEALSKASDPRLEPVMLDLLDDERVEVRSGAASILGRCGSIASIERLTAALCNRPTPALRRMIEEAVLAIQARAENAPGAMSFVGTEQDAGGRLSTTDEGAVSLAGRTGPSAGDDH